MKLRKIALIFGCSGFSIAILLALLWIYLLGHTSINPANAPLFSDISDCLWPSSIMLMAVHSDGFLDNLISLLSSAFVNGALYALVGLGLGALAKFFRD